MTLNNPSTVRSCSLGANPRSQASNFCSLSFIVTSSYAPLSSSQTKTTVIGAVHEAASRVPALSNVHKFFDDASQKGKGADPAHPDLGTAKRPSRNATEPRPIRRALSWSWTPKFAVLDRPNCYAKMSPQLQTELPPLSTFQLTYTPFRTPHHNRTSKNLQNAQISGNSGTMKALKYLAWLVWIGFLSALISRGSPEQVGDIPNSLFWFATLSASHIICYGLGAERAKPLP